MNSSSVSLLIVIFNEILREKKVYLGEFLRKYRFSVGLKNEIDSDEQAIDNIVFNDETFWFSAHAHKHNVRI